MTRLAAGDLAPAFSLTDDKAAQVSLADYAGKRVVVYFYPSAMTPGCTTQAVDFTAAIDEFAQAGLAIVGISPDKPERLAKFREKESIAFPLLSDPERETLKAYGAFGKKMMYGKEVEGVIRSTFLIEVDAAGRGEIKEAQYNVRAKGHVAKLMKELSI